MAKISLKLNITDTTYECMIMGSGTGKIDWGDGTITTDTDYHYYSETGTYNVEITGITEITTSEFKDLEPLKSVIIGEGIENIPTSAFENCTYLEMVVIPSTCTMIYSGSFTDCVNLNFIYLMGSGTYLSDSSILPTTMTHIYCYNQYLSTYKTIWANYADIIVNGDMTLTFIKEAMASKDYSNEILVKAKAYTDTRIAELEKTMTITLNAPDGGTIIATVNIYDESSGELEETVNYNGSPVSIELPKDFSYKVVLGGAVGYFLPVKTEYTGIMNTDQSITATYRSAIIYGVSRSITSSSSSWTRTDSAEGKVANATKSGGTVVNDFDSIEPWASIKTVNYDVANDTVVAEYGDTNFTFTPDTGIEVMTYFPECYIHRYIENGVEYIKVSPYELANYEHCPAFYIGRYTTSSGVRSVSGASSTVSQTITAFRNQATGKGTGWQQLDIRALSIIQCLYLVEYANGDSQSMLGQGNCSTSAQIVSGGCDDLGMKSGCLANAGATAVIYRGVENIFGNIWQFVDGVNIQDGQAWVCYDYTWYVSDKFESPYTKLGYVDATSSGSVYQRGYDENNQLIGITSAVGASVYGDYYWYNSGNRIVLLGGSWADGSNVGLFYLNAAHDSSDAYSNLGSRLLKFV